MRRLAVHLTPALVAPEELRGAVVVAIDILRATTTIIHALAAGAESVIALGEIAETEKFAGDFPTGHCLRAGERGGQPIPGFDLGNSPSEYTSSRCGGRTILFTTTNGTRAILHARQAKRVLIGAFSNFSAVCQELLSTSEDVHLLCAGTEGEVALEDTIFAGAVVHGLAEKGEWELNDGSRMAWDAFEGHGQVLLSAFELATGGRNLIAIGLGSDLGWAARVDRFGFVPEAVGNPPAIRIVQQRWEARHWPR